MNELAWCQYLRDGGWSTQICGNLEPCPDHTSARCAGCGQQTRLTHGCPEAGNLVCGAQLCATCEHCGFHSHA